MKTKLTLAAAGIACLMSASSAFAAAPAVAMTAVNLRAGPSTHFPVVTVVPSGGRIVTYGCLPDYSWCDIRFAGARGWLAARYIRLAGPRVIVTPTVAVAAGIPIVRFNRAYWQAHYAARPWARHWHRYARVRCVGARCTVRRTIIGPYGRSVSRRVIVAPY